MKILCFAILGLSLCLPSRAKLLLPKKNSSPKSVPTTKKSKARRTLSPKWHIAQTLHTKDALIPPPTIPEKNNLSQGSSKDRRSRY